MKYSILAAALTAAFPVTAQAQMNEPASVYVGGQIGYHDIGEIDIPSIAGVPTDSRNETIGGLIYGGYAGVDFPVGKNLFAGVEGNFNFGSEEIDSDYGVTANFGTRFGDSGSVFARLGYQWIDFDLSGIGADLAEEFADALGLDGQDRQDFIDDFRAGFDSESGVTEGDFLVGIGTEFGVMETAGVRLTADTVSFDTIRVAAGFTFRF